jgi:hypothetical protein
MRRKLSEEAKERIRAEHPLNGDWQDIVDDNFWTRFSSSPEPAKVAQQLHLEEARKQTARRRRRKFYARINQRMFS